MGVAWGDYDADGDLDLFVTNWLDENNVLYRNNGDGTLQMSPRRAVSLRPDWTRRAGGTAFFDADNDGDLDIFFRRDTSIQLRGKRTGRRMSFSRTTAMALSGIFLRLSVSGNPIRMGSVEV